MVEAYEPFTYSLKVPPLLLEKRKSDGSDWKCPKKIDYQRLETVLEEVQLSAEGTSSRCGAELGRGSSEGEEIWDPGHAKGRKPWFYNLMSITEHPELLGSDESQTENEKPPQQQPSEKNLPNNRQASAEKDVLDGLDEQSESSSKETIPLDKRSLMNGMMEILPIFSNHEFVCSRDAISIEETEEPDVLEKLTLAGKFPPEARAPRDPKPFDVKPIPSAESDRKSFKDKSAEKPVESKDSRERLSRETLESNVLPKENSFFSDKMLVPSSHFINFLLVLTPFSEERERIVNEQRLEEEEAKMRGICRDDRRGHHSRRNKVVVHSEQNTEHNVLTIVLAVFIVLFFFMAIAWKSYQPPGIMFHILNFIPFMRCRRSYLQAFFDKLNAITKAIRGGRCENPFLFKH